MAPCLLVLLLVFAGCSRSVKPEVGLAKVGTEWLTPEMMASLAGKPYDSLAASERWLIADQWMEERLFDLEGDRRGLDKNAEVQDRLASLRGALYRSHLLREEPSFVPTDSTITAYYAEHKSEFLRTADSYLIELYWGEKSESVEAIRTDLGRGDTTRLRSLAITAEGKWLAEHMELESAVAQELSKLKNGQVTNVRPADDGFRVLRLLESYPAGTVLDLRVVRDEIIARMLVERNHGRHDSVVAALKNTWGAELFLGKEE